jgi:hypothetical protein
MLNRLIRSYVASICFNGGRTLGGEGGRGKRQSCWAAFKDPNGVSKYSILVREVGSSNRDSREWASDLETVKVHIS